MALALPDRHDRGGAVGPAEPLPGLDHGRGLSRAARAAVVRAAPRQRAPGLEAVHDRAARVQRRALRLRVHRPGAAASHAAEPAGTRNARADDHLPQRHLLHDQHRSPALCRRSAPVHLQPALLRDPQSVPVGRRRPLCADRDHPRAPGRGDHRQLLRGHVAGADLHVRADRPHRGRPVPAPGHADDVPDRDRGRAARDGSDGRHRQGRAQDTADRGRAGGRLRPHQDAGHERRGILRHELRAPAGESERVDELPHHAPHDVVPDGTRPDVRPDAGAGSVTPSSSSP